MNCYSKWLGNAVTEKLDYKIAYQNTRMHIQKNVMETVSIVLLVCWGMLSISLYRSLLIVITHGLIFLV